MQFIKALSLGLMFSVVAALPAHADTDIDTIKTMASAQVDIERMRKQEQPDWKAIAAKYEIIALLVRATDQRKGLHYDRDIRAAMGQCAAGNKVKVHQQTLAKGLQHVVVLNIRDEMARLGESDNAGRKIAAYFEGIRPTFTRRDKDFFNDGKTLEPSADKALEQLTREGDQLPLTAQRELNDIIDRTYGLCVLYEIMQVEKLRDADHAACEVKVKEAEIFYRIIQLRIQRHDPEAHQVIIAMLGAGYNQMDAALLETYLNRGLSGITLR